MPATSIVKSAVNRLESNSADFALKYERFFRPLSELTELISHGVARVVMYTSIAFSLVVFPMAYPTSPDLAIATVEACVAIYVLGVAVMWLFMVGK